MNETINSILERRSTRGFSSAPITQEQMEILKQCALASPSARNDQSWHFSFVSNQELILKVEKDVASRILSSGNTALAERIRSRDMKVFYDAPLVVFISADRRSEWGEVDAGIAVQNLALAAHSLGLGSVIIGMCNVAFEGEEGERLGKLLNFPKDNRFAIAIAIGCPTVSKDAHPVKDDRLSVIS